MLVSSIDVLIGRIKRGEPIVTDKQEAPTLGFTAIERDPEGNPIGCYQSLPLPASTRKKRK